MYKSVSCSGPMNGNAARNNVQYLKTLIPNGNTCVSNVNMDRLLVKVAPDDKPLITNIVSVLQVMRGTEGIDLSNNMEVVVTAKGYDLISTLSNSLDKEIIITSNDFEEQAYPSPTPQPNTPSPTPPSPKPQP